VSKVRDYCLRAAASHDRWSCSRRILSYAYGKAPGLALEGDTDDFKITVPQSKRLLTDGYDYMIKLMNEYCKAKSSCTYNLRSRLGFPSDILLPSKNQKIVVMSTPIFHSTTQYAGTEVYGPCQVNNCINTYDTSFSDRARAFLFFCSNMPISESELEFKRRSDQLFLYACNESPLSLQTTRNRQDGRNVIMPFMNNQFNLTIGYKRSSELANTYYFNPYMSSYSGKQATTFHLLLNFDKKRKDLIIPKKKKMVAWVATNCVSPSGREHFVRALRKYVDVDVYGSGDCASDGEIPSSVSNKFVEKIQRKRSFPECPNDTRKSPDSDCVRSILREYKFYLALENSLCVDYITEKFFDVAFQNHVVPIVLGGSWYEPFVPREDLPSFIVASDFETPKHLAEYLKFLDKNDEEYLKYFEWRKVPVNELSKTFQEKVVGLDSVWCDLCKRLNENDDEKVSIIPDLRSRESVYENCVKEQSSMEYTWDGLR